MQADNVVIIQYCFVTLLSHSCVDMSKQKPYHSIFLALSYRHGMTPDGCLQSILVSYMQVLSRSPKFNSIDRHWSTPYPLCDV